MLPKDAQAKLDLYIQAYEEVKRRVGSDAVATVVLQEIAKDLRRSENPPRGMDIEHPATPKQLQFLKRLQIEPRAGLTKREASVLIDEAQGRETREHNLYM